MALNIQIILLILEHQTRQKVNSIYMTLQTITDSQSSRAVILDDHRIFGDAFSMLLEKLNHFKSVHPFDNEKEFVNFVRSYQNDNLFLFIDFYLKDQNVLSIFNTVKKINKKNKIIVISSLTNPQLAKTILDYRPNGFISKSSSVDTILKCINTINNRQIYTCPEMKNIITSFEKSNEVRFTKKELYLLHYFSQGMTIDQTAEKTFLSRHTIIAHRRKMMEKTNTHSITELLAYCRRLDLL